MMAWPLLFAALTLSQPAPAGPASDLAAMEAAVGRPVVRVDVANRSGVSDAEIRRLFLLEAGDLYAPAAVQRSLTLLAQKVQIRNVTVRGEPAGEGLALRVEVTPEPLIRSIRFKGNSAIPDKDLEGRIRTRVDRPALPPLLETDAEAIRGRYAEEGFPSARVTPRVDATHDPLWLNVVVDIDEGKPARITAVELGSDPAVERDRTLALLGLKVGSRASHTALRSGIQKVLKTYRKEGYAEARISRARFEPSPEGVVLLLPLVLGKPTQIRFEGIGEWAARSLRELVSEYYGEVIDADWGERMSALLADHLRSQGYRDAKASYTIAPTDEGQRVTFALETGPLVRVKTLSFEGNESFPAGQLKPYMSLLEGGFVSTPPFTQEALDRDLRVLRDLYESKGYLDAQVEAKKLDVSPNGAAALTIQVTEGQRYRLRQVTFECETGLSPEEARKVVGLYPGDPVNPAAMASGKVRLLAELTQRGYPEAEVEYTTNKDAEKGLEDLSFCVRAGPRARFGNVVVSGNARTATGVIQRELSIRKGEPWNPKEVLLSRQRLFRLGFFQKVKIDPFGPEYADGVQDVLVEVEEQDQGSISFGGGYGTEEGLKGFLEAGHANLFGTGRDLRARAEFQGQDRSYWVSFREPWLFSYQVDLRLRLIKQTIHRETYDLDSLGLQASLERKFTERVRGSILYALESNQLSNVTVDEDVESINNYVLSAGGPVLVWDSRDDPFNPKKGFQHTVQAEWATKALGSQVQYRLYTGSASGFFTWNRITLALLARGGFANPLGSNAELPANKRFYLGGRTTMRGFERDDVGPKAANGDPLGGDTMVNYKAELRVPVWKQFGGVLFWDAGNVWNRQKDKVDFLTVRQGAGFGLRYITPIGPVSLDLGFNLRPKDGEKPRVWHFTIGNAF